MSCVDDTVTQKLDPDAIHACTWENHVELDFRTAVGQERMGMHHVDQVVARGEHMTPGAEILLESFHGAEVELNVRRESGYLFGNGSYLDFEVFCVLG